MQQLHFERAKAIVGLWSCCKSKYFRACRAMIIHAAILCRIHLCTCHWEFQSRIGVVLSFTDYMDLSTLNVHSTCTWLDDVAHNDCNAHLKVWTFRWVSQSINILQCCVRLIDYGTLASNGWFEVQHDHTGLCATRWDSFSVEVLITFCLSRIEDFWYLRHAAESIYVHSYANLF